MSSYRAGYRSGYRPGYTSGYPGGGSAAVPAPPATGLAAWFKADAGVTQSAGLVSAWADQSGNGNDVSAPGTQPPFNASSINGLPGITFTGAEYLTRANSPLPAGNTPRTVLIVTKSASTQGGCMMCIGKNGGWFGPTAYLFGATGMTTLLSPAGFATNTSTDTTPYAGVPILIDIEYAGSGPITYNIDSNPLTITGAVGGTDSADFLAIGNYENSGPGALPYVGDICEILIYDHVLSNADLAIARGYIQGRYGV